jgi:hypothetical protein
MRVMNSNAYLDSVALSALIDKVKDRFDVSAFAWDLGWSPPFPGNPFSTPAASHYFLNREDRLKKDWSRLGNGRPGDPADLWLNPQSVSVSPWARKCARSTKGATSVRIFMLTPASVGARWFSEWVLGRAKVLMLAGRLSTARDGRYAKGCMLSVFGDGPGFELWDWRGQQEPHPGEGGTVRAPASNGVAVQ